MRVLVQRSDRSLFQAELVGLNPEAKVCYTYIKGDPEESLRRSVPQWAFEALKKADTPGKISKILEKAEPEIAAAHPAGSVEREYIDCDEMSSLMGFALEMHNIPYEAVIGESDEGSSHSWLRSGNRNWDPTHQGFGPGKYVVTEIFDGRKLHEVKDTPVYETRRSRGLKFNPQVCSGFPDLEPLVRLAQSSFTFDDFRRAVTQTHLMDLSDPDNHRWGRAFRGYDDEEQIDVAQILETGQYLEDIRLTYPQIYWLITKSHFPWIRIYRAVPYPGTQKIRIGDYVAIDPEYARMHGRSVLRGEQKTGYRVVSMLAQKVDVIWDEADFQEWVFSPRVLREEVGSLKSFWERCHGNHNPQVSEMCQAAMDTLGVQSLVDAQTIIQASKESYIPTELNFTSYGYRSVKRAEEGRVARRYQKDEEFTRREMGLGPIPEGAILRSWATDGLQQVRRIKLKDLRTGMDPQPIGWIEPERIENYRERARTEGIEGSPLINATEQEDGSLQIMDGNHRLVAWRQEGIEEAPVIVTLSTRSYGRIPGDKESLRLMARQLKACGVPE